MFSLLKLRIFDLIFPRNFVELMKQSNILLQNVRVKVFIQRTTQLWMCFSFYLLINVPTAVNICPHPNLLQGIANGFVEPQTFSLHKASNITKMLFELVAYRQQGLVAHQR